MESAVDWIWMQRALGIGSSKVKQVLSCFGDAFSFCRAGEREWRLCGLFSPRDLDRIQQTSCREAEQIYVRCREVGQWVLPYSSPDYPQLLRELDNPPCVLYGKGSFPDFSRYLSIAIVGTRSATPYGISAAEDLSFGLAKTGVIVVSGGALGIDSAAHKGALRAGGITVAVLACGINSSYLQENASLRHAISQNGSLVSEYPPDTPAASWQFPVRNRIISGLAKGTVVIEAGVKSGSLITAHLALEQGRDVFAVPGNVSSSVSCGSNRLIQNGAKMVTCMGDILEEYGVSSLEEIPFSFHSPGNMRETEDCCENASSPKMETQVKEKRIPVGLSPLGEALYGALSLEPCHIDLLAKRAGLSARQALQALTELEMENQVEIFPGRRYAIKS